MTTETNSNRPTHRVYAVIIKKEGGAKGAWLEIGAAWRNVSTILRQPSVEFKLGCLAISPVD